ncbi:MAG: c-type cytochrome [Burkholderiales bacterium]
MKRITQILSLPLLLALIASVAVHVHSAEKADQGKSGSADDLRPIYATAADVAEGKRVADGTCVRCHGGNGISTAKGVPNVAGQRPAYLYAKLRAYQAGTRGDHTMESAVKFLSDDALVKVAAYYSSLDPAQPRATAAAKGAPADPDPLAAGKSAAAACAGCHGEGGVSKTAGTPSVAGLDPKYFTAAINAYKSGQRKHDIMKSMVAKLSDQGVKNIALYYALQKPARAQTPAAGDQAAGKTAAAACTGCHGEQGVSSNPANPSLAGQDAQYVANGLQAYKSGSRKDATMTGLTSAMNERAMKDIAAYYAAQEPRAPKVDKPLTIAEWVQRCDRCHGVNGNSTDPRAPALSAQRPEYLEKALHAYQSGARKESVMAAMSSSLSDTDIENIAAYYARQKARAFVYVTVPSK